MQSARNAGSGSFTAHSQWAVAAQRMFMGFDFDRSHVQEHLSNISSLDASSTWQRSRVERERVTTTDPVADVEAFLTVFCFHTCIVFTKFTFGKLG